MDKKIPFILIGIFLLLLVAVTVNPYSYLVIWMVIFLTAVITLLCVDIYFSRRSSQKKLEVEPEWRESVWVKNVWPKKSHKKAEEELVWDESFWDKNVWKELEKYERSRKWYNRLGLGLVWEKMRRLKGGR